MLAERLPSIFLSLDTAASTEVTSIRSAAGMLGLESGLVTVPPFTPNRTSSMSSMIRDRPEIAEPEQELSTGSSTSLTWLRLVRMPVFVDRVEGVAEVVG